MRREVLILSLLLASCDYLPKAQAVEKPQAKPEANQVGRFQYFSASGKMPALVLDSVTGCVETIEEWHTVEDAKKIVWLHQLSDQVAAGTPNRCGGARVSTKPTVSNW